ncbi:Alpha/Beta hydrolase protein [Syncephalis fuscata]|nr:Alpha/Beta hydrolase protein [Syncephalis fuscata]
MQNAITMAFDYLVHLITFPFRFTLALLQAIIAALLFALPVYLRTKRQLWNDKHVIHNLPYGAPGDISRLVDIYIPPTTPTITPNSSSANLNSLNNDNNSTTTTGTGTTSNNDTTSYPVLVFIQDGGWTACKKELYYGLAARLSRRGIVVVVPAYQVHPRVRPTDMQQDILRLLRWLTVNARTYHADRRRILLVGHGTGAQLALLAALEAGTSPVQPKVAGVIGLAGIYDLPALYDTLRRRDRFRARALLRLFDVQQPEDLVAYSPLQQLLTAPAHRVPRLWLLHGTHDPLVLFKSVRNDVGRLAAAGIPVSYVAYRGWTRLHWLMELTHDTPDLRLLEDLALLAKGSNNSNNGAYHGGSASLVDTAGHASRRIGSGDYANGHLNIYVVFNCSSNSNNNNSNSNSNNNYIIRNKYSLQILCCSNVNELSITCYQH